MSDNIQRIHVSISGYEGPAVTLVCALKTDSNVLVIAKQEQDLREERKEGFALVTNLHLPASDWLFTDDHIRQGIGDYYARSTQGTLDIVEALSRHDPSNNIGKEGFDERGPVYRITPDITNGQLAIIAACAYADLQVGLGSAASVSDRFADLYSLITF